MVDNMKVNGVMENKMVREHIPIAQVYKEKAYGKMEEELNGLNES